jgi:hypothetical protein
MRCGVLSLQLRPYKHQALSGCLCRNDAPLQDIIRIVITNMAMNFMIVLLRPTVRLGDGLVFYNCQPVTKAEGKTKVEDNN